LKPFFFFFLLLLLISFFDFNISHDGTHFCVGDGQGVVHIFNLKTGKLVAELKHKRSRSPIRCCVFNHNSKFASFLAPLSSLSFLFLPVIRYGCFHRELFIIYLFIYFRNLMYGGKETLVWRYDFVEEETLAEWAKLKDKTSSR
jgi:hypothetical protein